MKTIIQLCGLYSIGLALFHICFWKIFRWREDLRQASISTRAIIQIANLRLIYLFLLIAFLCFRFPDELASTPLGRNLMAGIALFWLGRFIEQFIFLRYNRMMIHILTVVFAAGAILFSIPVL